MAGDFDKRLADELENDDTFKAIMGQLREAATGTATFIDRQSCTKEGCNCKHFRTIQIPDYKLKMAIIEFLANRGVGRPAQADSADDSEKITFIREVRK